MSSFPVASGRCGGGGEAVAAHDLADRGSVGRTAGRRVEHRGDLVEVARSEQAWRRDGEERRVLGGVVRERVHRAARDEDDLARMQLTLFAVDRERGDAGEAVVGLLESVVT